MTAGIKSTTVTSVMRHGVSGTGGAHPPNGPPPILLSLPGYLIFIFILWQRDPSSVTLGAIGRKIFHLAENFFQPFKLTGNFRASIALIFHRNRNRTYVRFCENSNAKKFILLLLLLLLLLQKKNGFAELFRSLDRYRSENNFVRLSK